MCLPNLLPLATSHNSPHSSLSASLQQSTSHLAPLHSSGREEKNWGGVMVEGIISENEQNTGEVTSQNRNRNMAAGSKGGCWFGAPCLPGPRSRLPGSGHNYN